MSDLLKFLAFTYNSGLDDMGAGRVLTKHSLEFSLFVWKESYKLKKKKQKNLII